jgi:hypothetical protein
MLLEYCAGRLHGEAAAALGRHIETCSHCQEFAATQQAVWSALDSWEAAPVSSGFDRKLYQRIDAEVSWWERAVRPFRPLLARQGLPVAAAACLAVMAGYILERPRELPTPVRPAAQVEAIAADQVEHVLDDIELLREFQRAVRTDAAQREM